MNILIVDDEPGLAAGLAGWLEENGWGTLGVATTSDEAVEWINRNGRVDVLICDVALEPADGFTLRETIQPHLPKMQTIFISGYDLSEHTARMEGCRFLQKPVTGETLDNAIRSLFETEAKPRPVAAQLASAAEHRSSTPRLVGATPNPVKVRSDNGGPFPASPATPAPRISARPRIHPSGAPGKSSYPVAKRSAQAVAEQALPPDELVGTDVGNYHIEAKIEQGAQGPIYRAIQKNMGRKVRLCTLDKRRAQDPLEIERFISNASAKANVRHPYILAVYEAGESDGLFFYSCECVAGRSLKSVREAGDFLDERTALQALKVAAEALAYFSRENIAHNPLSESCLFIGGSNRPRMANIAVHEAAGKVEVAEEMRELGRIIAGVLPESPQRLGVRSFALSLASDQGGAQPDWSVLSQRIASMEPTAAPEDAYKLEAQEQTANQVIQAARSRQRKSMILSSAVSLCLLALALGSLWWFLFRPKGADVRISNRMIEIPGGEFVYQDGEKVNLRPFYIDEYEVTIGQYAEFLHFLDQHPEEASKFEHPAQPRGKSHVPEEWADQNLATAPMPGYYARARQWGSYKDAPLDVNCPVFGVDWFDAFAYAKWQGRRLPTEQEWEKAARGTQGFKYPWGNEPDAAKANSGNDLDPNPKKGGEKDGYKRWAPVDAKTADRSPFDVFGMAGNVSEWTASFDNDPRMASNKIPVIRGGNWRNPDYSLSRRVLLLTELQADDALGFRTAADSLPGSARR
jgi:formylglycine-generating enzyme required for sulfatase activity/DNA-binding NarL/FixJ family response regulator